MLNRTEIEQALARGYCNINNESKVVDTCLISAMATEVMAALKAAEVQPAHPPTPQGLSGNGPEPEEHQGMICGKL